MSRIYEALKRIERPDEADTAPALSAAAPAPPANTLDEYPREATIVAERQARAGAKAAEPARPWSSSAERIVSVAQRVDGRRAVRTDSGWRSKLVAGAGLPVAAMHQYRRLAAALEDAQVERGVRTVMVTSAAAGEGKTLTVANLGLMLSETHTRRVLLIDADLRHPSLHQVFSTPNRTGLSDVLAHEGGELPIVEISDSLSLLPSGHAGSNPLAALTSGRMVSLLGTAPISSTG
jgi:Mrp family chromosome partitioning ATPase